MGALLPNPPIELNPIVGATQLLYSYAVRNVNNSGPQVVAAYANSIAITATGTQVISPTNSTLNGVTRIPREVRQSGAGANAGAGWNVDNNSATGACVFPGANGDGGFRTRIYCGMDAQVGSVAVMRSLTGIGRSGGGAMPSVAIPLTNAAVAWMGVYNLGAGDGLRFGYKVSGAATIFPLDDGTQLDSLWAPYTGWYVDIFCSPNGPRTFYTVAKLNAAATAYEPLLVGSTTLFNPGRVSMGPWHHCLTSAAGGNSTDSYFCAATQLAYPFGSLSL